ADAKLNARIDELCAKLPDGLWQLQHALGGVKAYSEYDVAANRAAARVWLALERFYSSDAPSVRLNLLSFAGEHMAAEAQARICPRLGQGPAGVGPGPAPRPGRPHGLRP